MYRLIINDSKFTIPKGNIGLLAYSKGYEGNLFDFDNAVAYLESLGVEVEEVKDHD